MLPSFFLFFPFYLLLPLPPAVTTVTTTSHHRGQHALADIATGYQDSRCLFYSYCLFLGAGLFGYVVGVRKGTGTFLLFIQAVRGELGRSADGEHQFSFYCSWFFVPFPESWYSFAFKDLGMHAGMDGTGIGAQSLRCTETGV